MFHFRNRTTFLIIFLGIFLLSSEARSLTPGKEELRILNIHSSPQKGDIWSVNFQTQGKSDLKIIPQDQATIEDDEFSGLYCGQKKVDPQILKDDIIFYPGWQCDEIARVEHYTRKQGNHILQFVFNKEIRHAYNAAYDIAVLNSLEHDTIDGDYNSLVMIDATHFILAYRGETGDGFISTFSIDPSTYAITELNTLEHDTSNGSWSSLIKIDDTHFMVAYSGTDFDGYISTFSIDGSYAITELNTLEYDTDITQTTSLVMIDATHFILAYAGTDNDGFIKTFSIDGSYAITEINSLEHDIANGTWCSLVKIDATHFILAYATSGNDGQITTFSIDGSYNITEINSIEHDLLNGTYNSLVMIDATHFILAYTGDASDGYLATFSIDGSYNITELNSLEHDTTNAIWNSLIMLDATHFIVAYTGTSSYGYIKTFSIDGSYAITEVNSLEHYSSILTVYTAHSLVKINSTRLILAFADVDNDGILRTFSVASARTPLKGAVIFIKSH
ncbi:MAG: hypothetical protein HQL27_07965 [Candidatus Omnitrophica bacterium]|nr:hypothetical protein [Candidatus Omnitrophota bacterium]